MGDVADAAGRLYFLAVVIVAIGNDGLCAIFVGEGLRGRQLGAGLLVVIVVGPVVPFFDGGVSEELLWDWSRWFVCMLTWASAALR